MIHPDTLDDILGDIDDNEIDRACATIARVAKDLTVGEINTILRGAKVAGPVALAMIRNTLRDHQN